MEVIILRGISGAGKDAWIEKMINDNAHDLHKFVECSADHYHTILGNYCWIKENAQEAHRQCFLKFLKFAQHPGNQRGLDFLIVNNTNTTVWEIAPYYRAAEAFNLPVKIVRVHCELVTGFRRNVHGVPAGTVLRQWRNINNEVLPSHWKEEIVFPEEVT